MFKKIFYTLSIFFLLASCGGSWDSVKQGISGEKRMNSDEFLIKKKDPLILPPDYEALPTPGDRKKAKQEKSIFENVVGDSNDDISSSKSLEESIMKKIKRR